MLLTRLRYYLAAFGANPARWPATWSTRWLRRWAGLPAIRAEQRQAEELDRVLDIWKIEPPSAQLAGDIVRRTLAMPQPLRLDTGLGFDTEMDISLLPPLRFRLGAFVLALSLGCWLGWYGARAANAWSDDWLNLVALAAVQEDFVSR